MALLDGEVGPAQYAPKRIRREDVQELLRRVEIRPAGDLSRRFPEEMPCRIGVCLKDGRTLEVEKRDYEGFFTRPMSWERALEKFEGLAAPHANRRLRDSIAYAVRHLEDAEVRELTDLLGRIGKR